MIRLTDGLKVTLIKGIKGVVTTSEYINYDFVTDSVQHFGFWEQQTLIYESSITDH